MKKVTRYTRAGKDGKFIYCPRCGESKIVYHFSWGALTCRKCDKTTADKIDFIKKEDWLLEPRES